jgi:hypothetical protein
MKRATLGLVLLVTLPASLRAQGYLLRLDARVQSVAYRGVRLDSIALSAVDTAANGALYSPDGFAVSCAPGGAYCSFYRPGSSIQNAPAIVNADLTMWGLGLPGLSLHANARAGGDLVGGSWPGTEPAVQLLEAYARYQRNWLTAQLGRQVRRGRLGFTGFDGAAVGARAASLGLSAEGYLGLGLARASVLPATSNLLNPFDEFQPTQRQLVAGVDGDWRFGYGDVHAEYQREVDRDTHNFVSERVGVTASLHPVRYFRVDGGSEYDLASGSWGSSEIDVTVTPHRRFGATGGIRLYRPFFNLWTIWGAFSPVGFHAYRGSAWVQPVGRLELHASGEHYQYEETFTSTALVTVADHGWRWAVGAGLGLGAKWHTALNYHAESGPGASSRGWDGSVSWTPGTTLTLTADGGYMERPLEFRYEQSNLGWAGLNGDLKVNERLHFNVSGTWYGEDRQRPDASGFDWSQTRILAGVSWLLGSGADRLSLPPAVRRRGSR